MIHQNQAGKMDGPFAIIPCKGDDVLLCVRHKYGIYDELAGHQDMRAIKAPLIPGHPSHHCNEVKITNSVATGAYCCPNRVPWKLNAARDVGRVARDVGRVAHFALVRNPSFDLPATDLSHAPQFLLVNSADLKKECQPRRTEWFQSPGHN
ncbi:hypothetical protein PTTG_26471 [Puccinia triticina 1-1 BBBD Race 1]|uniref:Uncharacterized protein n=2 Tax=Puccinia triticina TaxID=208348 RepID=A0A180GUB2_PUCT1|nr:hypothetical protein PTTG_26471 [Puccinia triticina 1-1 BBBD Race 1]